MGYPQLTLFNKFYKNDFNSMHKLTIDNNTKTKEIFEPSYYYKSDYKKVKEDILSKENKSSNCNTNNEPKRLHDNSNLIAAKTTSKYVKLDNFTNTYNNTYNNIILRNKKYQ